MEGLDVPSKSSTPSVKLPKEADLIETNQEESSLANLNLPEVNKQTTKGNNHNDQEESEIEGFLKSLTSLKNNRANIDNFYDSGLNLNQHLNLYSSQLFNDFINSTEGTNGDESCLNPTSKSKGKSTEVNTNAGIESQSFDSLAAKWNPYYEGTFNKQELSSTLKLTQSKMSEGPPHHSHGRQAPSPNTAWNHLQVPNYFPRQPQHAHMSNEHPILHQPTWHTPTTEPVKSLPHSHLFNLEQMISDRSFPKHSPGVDLTLQRNGSQNGELPTTPISLSVRDANKINSLAASAIDVQGSEIKSLSPGLKSHSPGLKGPILKSISPGLMEKSVKRPTKKMEQILERLNPTVDKGEKIEKGGDKHVGLEHDKLEKSGQSSVIVQSTSVHDENSNSNSVLSNTILSNSREEDVVSPFSNEDSMDSNKSRRKRKPSKTMRVSKDTVVDNESEPLKETQEFEKIPSATTERRRSGSAPPGSPSLPPRQRRKTSSESETIDNIAAMIQSTECKDLEEDTPHSSLESGEASEKVATINKDPPELSKGGEEKSTVTLFQTPAQKKITDPNSFVEVENKLEEMFAGITDDFIEPTKIEYNSKVVDLGNVKNVDEKETSNLGDDSVTSTLSDLNVTQQNKRKRTKSAKGQHQNDSETYSKKKKSNKKSKSTENSPIKNKANSKKNKNVAKQLITKTDLIKDIYAYDSGSNASSSRSKGPFIQIKGSRDSPISVNIINTPMNEDDSDKKVNKSKKYHDDTEYRHKVRSRGLHCSTLSNKYDAQTRDASWICVFCKRGPHATDPHLSGPSRFNATIIIPPPGDLFGPYIITGDSPEYQRRLEDPYDQQFKSKKVARAVIASNKIVNKKVKRKLSDSYDSRSSLEGNDGVDIYLGITETRDKVYEVWAHEDCIVWSPGVYLVGPKIIGLEEAVWTSCNVICCKCRYKGANVCCVKRGCMNVVHFGCAAASEWFLDEDNYKAFCVLHKKQ